MAAFMRGLWAVLRREPWWAEFWSAITAITWAGLSYASPADMERWPSMQFLLRIMPDDCWQALGLTMGVAQMGALLGDWRWLRWGGAVVMCWFWALLTLGVWMAVPWAPGTAVYAGWAGINIFSILRLLRPIPRYV